MNLIPMLLGHIPSSQIWGHRTLANGEKLTLIELGEILRGTFVLIGALLTTKKALQAFPADEAHYPEVFSTGDDELVAMLPTVLYCPFCGSEDMHPEETPYAEERLQCNHCKASGIPMQMEVHSRRTLDSKP